MEGVIVEPIEGSSGARRSLSDLLGTTALSINFYRLAPGERLAGLHAHERQEEVFVVLEERLAFETPDDEVVVAAGDVTRFAPREHKSGVNRTDGSVAVLALVAPPDGGAVFVWLSCPDCTHDELRLAGDHVNERPVCPECETVSVPACPDCGGSDLLAVRDRHRGMPVSACRECVTRLEL